MNKLKTTVKYIILAAVVLVVALMLYKFVPWNQLSSSQSPTANSKKEIEFLTKNTWSHYDPICAEAAVISFGEDGAYSYHCENGEPFGDYEPYETFFYDAEKQKIIIYSTDEALEEREIPILEQREERLLLFIDGRVKEFLSYEAGYFPPDVHEDVLDDFIDSSSFETILEKDGNILKTARGDYDGDIAEHRENIRSMKLADDVVFEDISIRSVMKDGDEKTKLTRKTYTGEEMEAMLEDSSTAGFLWYNEKMEIEKVILYGETLIWK